MLLVFPLLLMSFVVCIPTETDLSSVFSIHAVVRHSAASCCCLHPFSSWCFCHFWYPSYCWHLWYGWRPFCFLALVLLLGFFSC
jgi:hypothetical protein